MYFGWWGRSRAGRGGLEVSRGIWRTVGFGLVGLRGWWFFISLVGGMEGLRRGLLRILCGDCFEGFRDVLVSIKLNEDYATLVF